MGSGAMKNAFVGFWLVAVAAVSYLLLNEEKFFALSGIPVANVIQTTNDVTYRSEDDTRWKSIAGTKQGVFDGDKVSTGRKSSALIDFGDGRAASIGEESSLSVSTIRQNSGLTYILSLPKGSVAIQKFTVATSSQKKPQYPIIIRSGGRDFVIEPGEEKGVVKGDKGVVEFKGKRQPKVTPVAKKEVQLVALPQAILAAIPMESPSPVPEVVAPPPPPIQPLKPVKPSKPNPVVSQPPPPPPPAIAGTEIILNIKGLKASYVTFQSLNAAVGTLGNVSWTEPPEKPSGWSAAIELSNGGKTRILEDLQGSDRIIKIEDIGPLSSQREVDGLPCALVGIRGGARLSAQGRPVYSFLGKPAEMKICSYRDAAVNVPLVVGLSSIESEGIEREEIFPPPPAIGLKYQLVITSPSEYFAILPLMKESKNIRVARSQGPSARGIFIAKSGKVVIQLAGIGFNARAADRILNLSGGDFVFKGERSALYDASSFSVDQLKEWVSRNASQGKKVYLQKSGTLIPVSRDFLEERREVAAFVKSVATQLFTEKVDIVAFK